MYDSNFYSDEYEHPLSNLVYTPTSLPGHGVSLQEFNSQLAGCNCTDVTECLSSHLCQNVHICSQNYSSDKLLLESKWDSGGIVECNSECKCLASCVNRIVQFGPRENLEVFQTTDTLKGYGLRTKQFIPKGAFICEYAGELISMSEARRRFRKELTLSGMNYIFVLREIVELPSSKVIETIVDPSLIGNIGRYINHSCLPNAGILPVRIDSFVPKLSIFAKTNILPGEEITYDYSGGQVSPSEDDGSDCLKPCYCQSGNCKGFLPFDASLV